MNAAGHELWTGQVAMVWNWRKPESSDTHIFVLILCLQSPRRSSQSGRSSSSPSDPASLYPIPRVTRLSAPLRSLQSMSARSEVPQVHWTYPVLQTIWNLHSLISIPHASPSNPTLVSPHKTFSKPQRSGLFSLHSRKCTSETFLIERLK